MNQILITEKLYVTPELKRKKKLYKFNFILSLVIILILISFYIHSEYARNKEDEVSQDLLLSMMEQEEQISQTEVVAEEDEKIWKIMIASIEEPQAEQGIEEETEQQELQQEQQQIEQEDNGSTRVTTQKKNTVDYVTEDGEVYQSIGRIQIPSINVDYVILSETSVDWLKISPCRFYGPETPNEVGNLCIAGHNYRNKRFFSKVPTLKNGDKIKITDLNKRTVTYVVTDKYEVDPKDTSCLNQETDGKRVITLITCTNDSKKRVIIKAEEKI